MQKLAKTSKKVLVSVISAVILLLSATFSALIVTHAQNTRPTTEAFTNSDTSSYYSVGELLTNASTAVAYNPFNSTNVTKLFNVLSGGSGTVSSQLTSLTTSAATPITSQTLRAKTYQKTSGQSVVVRLGGLDWIVTYLSKDADGNLIATLWLSSNYQSAWSGRSESLGEHFGFVSGGLYSDWGDDYHGDGQNVHNSYAYSMYGTSYIRSETLNNPYNRVYLATGNTDKLVSASGQSTTTSNHPFALYTASNLGLTKYLTTPDQMQWMIKRQNPANRVYSSYWLSNESLTSGNSYNYAASDGWSSDIANYESDAGYDNWGKDYLWLPSAAEIGYNDTYDGLWETNTAERSIYTGDNSQLVITTSTIGTNQYNNDGEAYAITWTRSSHPSDDRQLVGDNPNGSSYDTGFASCSTAIRPCMLFNLTAVAAALSAGTPTFTVTVNNETDNVYPGTGSGYGTAIPQSKASIIVQVATLSGDLVTAQKISFYNQSTASLNLASYLTYGTQYRVRIIAPTYMRYTIDHYINADTYNTITTNSFIVTHTGEQSIEVGVECVQDDSWLTFYGG